MKKRAREIYREEYAISRQNWTEEASEIADSRVRLFEDRLMPKMIQYDNSLKFFWGQNIVFMLRECEAFFLNARQYNPNKIVIFAKQNPFHKNAIIAKILNA